MARCAADVRIGYYCYLNHIIVLRYERSLSDNATSMRRWFIPSDVRFQARNKLSLCQASRNSSGRLQGQTCWWLRMVASLGEAKSSADPSTQAFETVAWFVGEDDTDVLGAMNFSPAIHWSREYIVVH